MMELITRLTQQYPSSEGYVFKSCTTEYVVVLQKLEDTVTNESRSNVKDQLYAKFRGNKFRVVDIVHKFTQEQINKIVNSAYKNKITTYEKGKIVEVDDYCKDIDQICAEGIHYFKSPETAFYYYYELANIKNGQYKAWYGNGQLHIECTYKDGEYNGQFKEWYYDGQLYIDHAYKDGKLNGQYKKWYPDGKLCIECTYKDGKYDGQYKRWYENGKLWVECTYKDGKFCGQYKTYCENGEPDKEIIWQIRD